MARSTSTKLTIEPRSSAHSRDVRRLRRSGRVPGVLYGQGDDPMCFSVDARELRNALAASGAVLELAGDGGGSTAAVLKDAQRHPVRGEVMHIDLLRVDLNQPIQAPVTVHLQGGEDAPGVRDGGILEHTIRELNVEALPADMPDAIDIDVSAMEFGGTLHLSEIPVLAGVTFLDDPETVVASIVAPAAEVEEEPLETETGVVGEGEGEAEGSDADAGAEETPADAGDSGGE